MVVELQVIKVTWFLAVGRCSRGRDRLIDQLYWLCCEHAFIPVTISSATLGLSTHFPPLGPNPQEGRHYLWRIFLNSHSLKTKSSETTKEKKEVKLIHIVHCIPWMGWSTCWKIRVKFLAFRTDPALVCQKNGDRKFCLKLFSATPYIDGQYLTFCSITDNLEYFNCPSGIPWLLELWSETKWCRMALTWTATVNAHAILVTV